MGVRPGYIQDILHGFRWHNASIITTSRSLYSGCSASEHCSFPRFFPYLRSAALSDPPYLPSHVARMYSLPAALCPPPNPSLLGFPASRSFAPRPNSMVISRLPWVATKLPEEIRIHGQAGVISGAAVTMTNTVGRCLVCCSVLNGPVEQSHSWWHPCCEP